LVDEGGDAVEEADVDGVGDHNHVEFGGGEEEFEGGDKGLLFVVAGC